MAVSYTIIPYPKRRHARQSARCAFGWIVCAPPDPRQQCGRYSNLLPLLQVHLKQNKDVFPFNYFDSMPKKINTSMFSQNCLKVCYYSKMNDNKERQRSKIS